MLGLRDHQDDQDDQHDRQAPEDVVQMPSPQPVKNAVHSEDRRQRSEEPQNLGASWLGVRATLGRALRQAEGALWEAEVAAAIAEAAAVRPPGRRVTTSRSYRRSAP